MLHIWGNLGKYDSDDQNDFRLFTTRIQIQTPHTWNLLLFYMKSAPLWIRAKVLQYWQAQRCPWFLVRPCLWQEKRISYLLRPIPWIFQTSIEINGNICRCSLISFGVTGGGNNWAFYSPAVNESTNIETWILMMLYIFEIPQSIATIGQSTLSIVYSKVKMT